MADPTTPNPKQKVQQPLPVPPIPEKQEFEQQENLAQGTATSKKKESDSPAPEPAPTRKDPFSTEDETDQEQALQEIFNSLYNLRKDLQSAAWGFIKKGFGFGDDNKAEALSQQADSNKKDPFSTEDEAGQEQALQEIFNSLYNLRKDIQSAAWGFIKKGFAVAFSGDGDKAEADLAQQDDNAEKNKKSETEESPQKIEASDKDDAQNKDEDNNNTLDKKDDATFDKVGDEEPNAKTQQQEEQAYDELAKGSDKTNESEPAVNANSDNIQASAESSASSGPDTPAIPNMTAMSSASDDSAQTAQNYDVMAATSNGDADAAASTAVQGVSVEEVAEVAVVVAL